MHGYDRFGKPRRKQTAKQVREEIRTILASGLCSDQYYARQLVNKERPPRASKTTATSGAAAGASERDTAQASAETGKKPGCEGGTA